MALEQQQNLLAKLYTDAEFRRAFLSAPEKIGAENYLDAAEIGEIVEIMPEELEFFADSLFWKRLRETEKFLPLTKKLLGEDFTSFFREFAPTFNPRSIKKHLADALEFSRFLQTRPLSAEARTAARFERARLEFFGLEKRFVVCRLDFDVRRLFDLDANRPGEAPAAKKRIAVWLRIGGRTRHFLI